MYIPKSSIYHGVAIMPDLPNYPRDNVTVLETVRAEREAARQVPRMLTTFFGELEKAKADLEVAENNIDRLALLFAPVQGNA